MPKRILSLCAALLFSIPNQISLSGGGGRFYIFNADYDHIHQLPKDLLFTFPT